MSSSDKGGSRIYSAAWLFKVRASFRFSPKILARLGEELNQSLDQSVLELVKNAYDADARNCSIEFHDEAAPGGRIIVADDGTGMSPDQITNGWLVLGRSGKESGEITKLGRFPAGNKGLGRLAALRLGHTVEVTSVAASNTRLQHDLLIDWKQFDGASLVEEVALDIVTTKKRRPQGTKIVLGDLRHAVSAADVRKLARSLVLLTDPFSDGERGFNVELISEDYAEIADLVKRKYFDAADFHLKATIDGRGNASVHLLDWQGEVLAEGDVRALRRGKSSEAYRVPKLEFDLWIFLLGGEAPNFAAAKITKGEIRSWLASFGGVHVYDKGIRVAPYGNTGDDWLEMNLARARSPEERPSTNTAIGRVMIHDSRHKLMQKTDRSGFIEDATFLEVRAFARDALEWLARWRLKQAETRRSSEHIEAPRAAAKQRQKLEVAISGAPPKIAMDVRAAFKGYEKRRDRESELLRKEIQLYRTLSTAGITAATFAHESQGSPIKLIEMGVTALEGRIPKLVKESQRGRLLAPLRDISGAVDSLSVLTRATLSLVSSAKRRVGRVELHKVIGRVDKLFKPFLKGRGAELVVNLGVGSPFLRASEAAIESIITNLINNSLAAFESAGTHHRTIVIETLSTSNSVQLSVGDSGPGINGLDLDEIWLPGITTNPEGTGLGLTIIRDTVRDLGGKVHVEANGQQGGALFRIQLPILGS